MENQLTPEQAQHQREQGGFARMMLEMPSLPQQILSAHGGTLRASEIDSILAGLPTLDEASLTTLGHRDSSCPVCMNTYLAILAEEEMALAMESPAHPTEELGVTRLSQSWQCGHTFCRKDITKWVKSSHNSCPMCRRPLVDPSTRPEQMTGTPSVDDPIVAALNDLNGSGFEEEAASLMSYLSGNDGIQQLAASLQQNALEGDDDDDDEEEYPSMFS